MSAFHMGYRPPPSEALRVYASQLYDRRAEGILVPRISIAVGDWQPAQNDCHGNAIELSLQDSSYVPVHGWLYFDLGGFAPFVRFAAHSVVANGNGELVDITPAATPLYPFIRADLSQDYFVHAVEALVEQYGSSNCLDHLKG